MYGLYLYVYVYVYMYAYVLQYMTYRCGENLELIFPQSVHLFLWNAPQVIRDDVKIA